MRYCTKCSNYIAVGSMPMFLCGTRKMWSGLHLLRSGDKEITFYCTTGQELDGKFHTVSRTENPAISC